MANRESGVADLEALYRRFPVSLQHLACSFEGWRIQRRRFSGGFLAQLNKAEERQDWSIEERVAYRDARLRAFVQHAATTVPYYSDLFQRLRIRPEDIRTMADLRVLPILTRQQVQETPSRFVSSAVSPRDRVAMHTSGTTGGGLRFSTTRDAVHEQWATWWRYRRSHGIEPGTWCAYFGGRSVADASQAAPPYWRYDYAGKQVLFSGYHMSRANLHGYVAELRRRRLPWLHGYPSLLALLASYILDSGEGPGYQPRWITVGAENLLPQQANLIDRAFGTKPKQHYGMAEAAANFSECEHGVLHVDEDFSAVEFASHEAGEVCRVVGTNFTNPATPLLRYEVGDLATLDERTCECGRGGRLVANVDGRIEDYVVLRNGARIGRMDHVFKDMINVREAQIHQSVSGMLTVRVVRGSRYTDQDEADLLRELRKRVGEDEEIKVEYAASLPRSSSGKLRLVVSEVAKASEQPIPSHPQ
jgi:phenylacetate-CoA ligase